MDMHKLEELFRPVKYKIFIEMFTIRSCYRGSEIIDIKLEIPCKQIKIHAEDPVIIKKIVKLPEKKELAFNRVLCHLVEIELGGLCENAIALEISFESRFRYDSKGCFVSFNEEESMISTHFEPIHARKAFPCFDEPYLKSIFQLTIKLDQELKVISNMPVEVIRANTYSFYPTPMMPCYLLHWTICKHPQVELDFNSTRISLYSFSSKTAEFLINLCKDSLNFYGSYFDLPYPLPKLDLISVNNMETIAMENWGAITYNTEFFEKDYSNDFEACYVVSRIIAHEIAHMWIGNLVTMKWWDEVWLNEGLARFLEFKCLKSIRPEFDSENRFLADVMFYSFDLDFPYNKTHSVKILDGNIFEDMEKCSDPIVYCKGAALVSYMEDMIGEENFVKGLREYLRNFQYGNATSEEFLEIMQRFTDFPIKEHMMKWISLKSYPLITVEKVSHENFKISQKSYDKSRLELRPILIKYVNDIGNIKELIIENKETFVEEHSNWIKLNHGSKGYYRVLYKNYKELYSGSKKLNFADTFGLINDIIFHYYHKKAKISEVLELFLAIVPEYEYLIISQVIQFFHKLFKNPVLIPHFRPFIFKVLKPIYEKFGFDSIPFEDSQRKLLIDQSYCFILQFCECKELLGQFLLVENPLIYKSCYYYCVLMSKIPVDIYDLSCIDPEFAIFISENSFDIRLLRFVVKFYRFSRKNDDFGYEFTENIMQRTDFFNAAYLLKACFLEIIENFADKEYVKLLNKFCNKILKVSWLSKSCLPLLKECCDKKFMKNDVEKINHIKYFINKLKIQGKEHLNIERLLKEVSSFNFENIF